MINLAQNGLTHNEVLHLFSVHRARQNITYSIQIWRNGGLFATTKPIRCSIECNYYNQVKLSSAMTIEDIEGVNFRLDRFQPVMILNDKGIDYVFRFYQFKVKTAKKTINEYGTTWDLQLFDESCVLQDNSIGDRLAIKAGEKYMEVIINLLNKSGFNLIDIENTDKKFRYDRDEWEENENILTVVNQLLGEMNYRSLEPTIDGNLTSYKYQVPSLDQVEINYRSNSASVIFPGKVVEYDDFKKYNRFIGYVSNPNIPQFYRFEYTNTDPGNPISAPNQGYIITAPPRNFETISNQIELTAAVLKWADEVNDTYEKKEIETLIMPHHGIREIIAVDCKGVSGVFVETAWSIDDFSHSGKMNHSLREVFL